MATNRSSTINLLFTEKLDPEMFRGLHTQENNWTIYLMRESSAQNNVTLEQQILLENGEIQRNFKRISINDSDLQNGFIMLDDGTQIYLTDVVMPFNGQESKTQILTEDGKAKV